MEMTSDAAGSTPAQTMRAGDAFYLQLYGHTGGRGLTSFEVKLYEDTAVCEVLPLSGTFSSSYTGPLQGELSSTYQVEGLARSVDQADSSNVSVVARALGRWLGSCWAAVLARSFLWCSSTFTSVEGEPCPALGGVFCFASMLNLAMARLSFSI